MKHLIPLLIALAIPGALRAGEGYFVAKPPRWIPSRILRYISIPGEAKV